MESIPSLRPSGLLTAIMGWGYSALSKPAIHVPVPVKLAHLLSAQMGGDLPSGRKQLPGGMTEFCQYPQQRAGLISSKSQ